MLEESVDSSSFVANGIEGRQDGLEVGYVYSEALEGFSAEIPDDSLDEVRNNPKVAYVEPDRVVTTLEQTLPWGIDRIDADNSPTAQAGDGNGAVSNVSVYVIDTGIDKNRADLNVTQHLNFHGGPNTDCDGHGTHVAGTLAAKDNDVAVVGVAPGAPLIGVKVLGCRGFGMASTVVEGIDWVTRHAIEGPDGTAGTADDSKPAVANMSLGDDSVITFVDQAVRESARKGVFYSIAAGNDGRDACKRLAGARGGRHQQRHPHHRRDHQERRGAPLEQLRPLRGPLGAGREHRIDEVGQRHEDDVRHLHGRAARGRDGRAVPRGQPHGLRGRGRDAALEARLGAHRHEEQNRAQDPARQRAAY